MISHNPAQINLRIRWDVYLGLLLIALAGFWPLTTGMFSVKNDDIAYFLPYRYNIVETLRHGSFPLWSPYIYMGFPIAGDMQSGVWNPVVWLLSITGRYNVFTLHAELLLYIYLGGIGMYKLMQTAGFSSMVAFTIACCYMFSGFITDSGQILCWVSCAAFLPFTYLYFIRLLRFPALGTSIKFSVANVLLFASAGYPFFFIVNTYFLFFGFVIFFINKRKNGQLLLASTCRHLIISALLFFCMTAAPTLAFLNLMPLYSRGIGLPIEQAVYNSYSFYSLISLIFPFSVTRDHPMFNDNLVISRSIYIGIMLLPFVVIAVVKHRTKWWNLVLILTLLAALLSLARLLPLRKLAYWFLPLLNNFRHPANFRLFVTIGLLALAGKGMHHVISSPRNQDVRTVTRLFALMVLCTLIATICLLPPGEALTVRAFKLSLQNLKRALDAISFREGILLSFLLQVPFLAAGYLLLKKRRYYWFCSIAILNVVVIAQPQIFCGTVAKNPVSALNRFIASQPEGFPKPDLSKPVALPDENTTFLYEYKEPLEFFFNKRIAINTSLNNPTILSGYTGFLRDSALRDRIQHYPFVYLADSVQSVQEAGPRYPGNPWLKKSTSTAPASQAATVSIVSFEPSELRIFFNSDHASRVVILQNHVSGWTATTAGRQLQIETVNKTFMGLTLPAGSYEVQLEYKPGWFLPGIIISGLGTVITLALLCFSTIRKTSESRT